MRYLFTALVSSIAFVSSSAMGEAIRIEPVYPSIKTTSAGATRPLTDVVTGVRSQSAEAGSGTARKLRIESGDAFAIRKFERVVIDGMNSELSEARCSVDFINSLNRNEIEKVLAVMPKGQCQRRSKIRPRGGVKVGHL